MEPNSIIQKIDTYDKYVKVVQVLTQGLWHSIVEIRSGHVVPTADSLYDLLEQVLKHGGLKHFPLPEIESWWAQEVLNAYNEVR